jgi:protein disulfide isomerase family A protein 5
LGKLDKEESYVLKYYLQGKEAKEYPSGRPLKALSFYNFVLNPNGEASWEELDTAPDVIHVDDNNIERVLAENKPTLVFFYAPNCVHCELFKPAYSAVATTLKGKANLCAVDASSPNSVRSVYKHKLTGFPAVKYFDKGIFQFDYGGERTEKGLIDWLKNPTAPVPPKPEPSWNDTPNDLNHLTDTSFDEFMNDHPVTLVIFYAPWCGHCKNARPFLEQAATTLKDNKSVAAIAAVDCTKETLLATRFEIKGYPTIKYFQNGEYLEDYIGKRTKYDFLQYLDTKMIQFQEAKQEL